ncbi:hypothetical protein B566_EDAN006155 [Ephemera danica]|nr:hypothetical protein B566_EDAN006155 [Ephemera danica]
MPPAVETVPCFAESSIQSLNIMIHYALIVRSRDGMALTVSTDCTNDMDKNMKEGKRYMKLIAKKTVQFPERCSMKVGSYIIQWLMCVKFHCISDSLILKSRQRYNRPHSLTTRVDLAELSKELKFRPPHMVTPTEVEPPTTLSNGLHRNTPLSNVSGELT